MRRDVCYVFPVPVDRLYHAYRQAATNDRFRREPDEKPYYTMSFGLNFSMKYNMNGGACTLRFMPCQNGSAVNLRFSIAQGLGARYEKYAQDLTDAAAQVIGTPGMRSQINVEEFLKPANMVSADAQPIPAPVAPVCAAPAQVEPVDVAPEPAPEEKTCAACGAKMKPEDRFCIMCGKPAQAPARRFCDRCGAEARVGAAFCAACGNKL